MNLGEKIKEFEDKLKISEGHLFMINLGNHLDKTLKKHKWSDKLVTDKIKLGIYEECINHLENLIYFQEQLESGEQYE